jgi:ATP phosphoribosyltransferase
VCDLGFVGRNVLVEDALGRADRDEAIVERRALGFGGCRLSIAVPLDFAYDDVASLAGTRIATSYPNILQSFFAAGGVNADIHTISGSVEIAPSIGLADAVCDLVSSGSTLFTNGLREVETVMRSEAVLISRKGLSDELSCM